MKSAISTRHASGSDRRKVWEIIHRSGRYSRKTIARRETRRSGASAIFVAVKSFSEAVIL